VFFIKEETVIIIQMYFYLAEVLAPTSHLSGHTLRLKKTS